MAKDIYTQKISSALVVLMNIGLSLLVVFLMRHTESLLNSDVRINLIEIVTQNKDAITSRLMMNVRSLDIPASDFLRVLDTEHLRNGQRIQEALRAYATQNNTPTLFIANQRGVAPLPGRPPLDISGRQYFRLAAEGISNISGKLISRINGEESFVISVPLLFEGAFIGSVQKVLSLRAMHEICSLSLFSAQGYMYIINKDGYVVIHSPHTNCTSKTDNYLRDLFISGNAEASEKLAADIKENKSGFTESSFDGVEIFSAYTPIESIHDWYLITSVPRKAVSPNANSVVYLFYIILFVIVFIFTSLITYILLYKNNQRSKIEKIAFVDTVTNGNTYNKFLVYAANAIAENKKLYFIVKFDIDNFKYINNFYGFAFGDQTLRRINSTVEKQLYPSEMIARVYADVFVLLLEDASSPRLNALLASMSNEDVILYFSVGVYTITDRTKNINSMVDNAGVAAESVKGKLDKPIAWYSDTSEQKVLHNEQMKRSIQLALDQREFQPFFQPKVNILTGDLVGCEALVRWKKQDGSFVFPNEFIPLAEQTGQIVDIDMQVYEKVLQFLKGLRELGCDYIPVSVNFSRLHLYTKGFIDTIAAKLKEYGIPPHLIELELTEGAIFDNTAAIIAFTKRVHDVGMSIAMDDFGSGYSSLNMLKDVPIDVLKIDKGFLSEGNKAKRDIVFSSVVDMAHKLDIKIVVEGVETIENIELMRQSGCLIAQGYYYAKPMNQEAFTAIVKKGRIE